MMRSGGPRDKDTGRDAKTTVGVAKGFEARPRVLGGSGRARPRRAAIQKGPNAARPCVDHGACHECAMGDEE